MGTSKKKAQLDGQRAASEVDKEIGRRLRLLRVDRNLSQQELGKVLGVSFQQIHRAI